jgi:CDP-diacylglycerol---glycerol-3-phosphate 3-phosphatidyltransferase
MALNAYARTITDRIVDPIGRGLSRLGFSADGLTMLGLVLNFVAVAVIVGVDRRWGAVVLAVAVAIDAFDGAVARIRGTSGKFGAFLDSVTDRVSDVAIFGTAAWLVRDDPLLFGVAMVALGGAQVTSYIRAKAEALGWSATVGVFERAERVIVMVLAFFFGFLPLALWILAIGSLVTIAQRVHVILPQAHRGSRSVREPEA